MTKQEIRDFVAQLHVIGKHFVIGQQEGDITLNEIGREHIDDHHERKLASQSHLLDGRSKILISR